MVHILIYPMFRTTELWHQFKYLNYIYCLCYYFILLNTLYIAGRPGETLKWIFCSIKKEKKKSFNMQCPCVPSRPCWRPLPARREGMGCSWRPLLLFPQWSSADPHRSSPASMSSSVGEETVSLVSSNDVRYWFYHLILFYQSEILYLSYWKYRNIVFVLLKMLLEILINTSLGTKKWLPI